MQLGVVQASVKVEVRNSHGVPTVPVVGDAVIARVTRISKRACNAEIIQAGDQPLDTTFKGAVRVQDVRASEIDKVTLWAKLLSSSWSPFREQVFKVCN
jgi:exosome complex RNA-binding protein Csl4